MAVPAAGSRVVAVWPSAFSSAMSAAGQASGQPRVRSAISWALQSPMPGSAVNVASLFYLTPPTTALIAWAMFGETLSVIALVGMSVAVAGVWLARKG